MRISAVLAVVASSLPLAACGDGSSSGPSGAEDAIISSATKAKVGSVVVDAEGRTLYRYAGDRSKADANGEGVGGQWFVVKAGAGAGSAASNTMGYNSGY